MFDEVRDGRSMGRSLSGIPDRSVQRRQALVQQNPRPDGGAMGRVGDALMQTGEMVGGGIAERAAASPTFGATNVVQTTTPGAANVVPPTTPSSGY